MIPEAFLYQIRTTSLPLTARAIFSSLPEPLIIRVRVSEGLETLPLTLCQLLKLTTITDLLHLEAFEQAKGGVQVSLSRDARTLWVRGEQLQRSIQALLLRCLGQLFGRSDHLWLMRRFAFHSVVFATLRQITSRMLRSTDPDEAVYIMLSGITSGYALGFNRAALFVPNDDGMLTGRYAIGPADQAEAHRIWESLEFEDQGIEDVIQAYGQRNFDTRFQSAIQAITLDSADASSDEVRQTLSAGDVRYFETPPGESASLAALDIQGPFVLAPLRAHGKLLALLFADHRYDGAPTQEEALSALAFFIDQTALIWENLSLLKRVEQQAGTDPLTGVKNRRSWREQLDLIRDRCLRDGRGCGLMILDVDHFKVINDTQGHEEGDRTLQRLAALLEGSRDPEEVIGRFGGDEFQVMCPGVSLDELEARMDEVGRAALEEGISLSIGGACWPHDCAEVEALFSTADARLYQAKALGRGCGCLGSDRVVTFRDERPIKK